MIERLVASAPAGLVLNVGAGIEVVGPQRDGQVIVNLDLSPPATPVARYVVGDVGAIPLRSGSCSMILAKDVLEHVADPMAAMRELRRTAGDSCSLVVTVPRAIPRAVWDDPTHVRGFTRRAVGTLVDRTGWQLDGPVRRIGGLPGAERLRLTGHLETVMRVPGLGHRFGTNWIFRCTPV